MVSDRRFERSDVRFLTLVEMLSMVVRKEESQRRVRVLAARNYLEGALDVAVSSWTIDFTFGAILYRQGSFFTPAEA